VDPRSQDSGDLRRGKERCRTGAEKKFGEREGGGHVSWFVHCGSGVVRWDGELGWWGGVGGGDVGWGMGDDGGSGI